MGYNIRRQIATATLATLWHQRAHMRPYEAAEAKALDTYGKGSSEHAAAVNARKAAWKVATDLGPYARYSGAAMAALQAIADRADEAEAGAGPDGKPIDMYRPGGTRKAFASIDRIHGEAGTWSRSAIQQGITDLRATKYTPRKKVNGKLVEVGPSVPVQAALLSAPSEDMDVLTFTVVDLATPYLQTLINDGIAKWDKTAAGNRKLVEAVPYVRASSRGHARPEPVADLEWNDDDAHVERSPADAPRVATASSGMFGEDPGYTQPFEYTVDPDEVCEGELEDGADADVDIEAADDVVDAETVDDTEAPVPNVSPLPVRPQPADTDAHAAADPVSATPLSRQVRAQQAVDPHHDGVQEWARASEYNQVAVDNALARADAAGVRKPVLVRLGRTVGAVERTIAERVHELLLSKQDAVAASLLEGTIAIQDSVDGRAV